MLGTEYPLRLLVAVGVTQVAEAAEAAEAACPAREGRGVQSNSGIPISCHGMGVGGLGRLG